MTSFDACLPILLTQEGGFVNDPADVGGITNLGVTKAVWEHWTGEPCSEAGMRALTPAMVAPLYRAQYWNAVSGDSLPPALALCAFDWAVNAGAGRAGSYLQGIIGAVQDGHIGPGTLRAVQQYVSAHGLADLIRHYIQARRDFYRMRPAFLRFGKGWLNRCDAIETAALRLVP